MIVKREYPYRVYFEDQGYNYVKCVGELLFDGVLFSEATIFDEDGFAEVVTFSGEKKKIDKYGNFCK